MFEQTPSTKIEDIDGALVVTHEDGTVEGIRYADFDRERLGALAREALLHYVYDALEAGENLEGRKLLVKEELDSFKGPLTFFAGSTYPHRVYHLPKPKKGA